MMAESILMIQLLELVHSTLTSMILMITMSLSQMIATSKLNSFMCGGLNRTGPLCSKCQKGMGPVVLSCKWQCVACFDKRYVSYSYLVSSSHFMFVSDAFSASRDLC